MRGESEQEAFYSELGANIRTRRKAVQLSQEALAQLVGLTRTSLSNIESGRQHPPLHTFCEIVEQLQTDPSSLLPPRRTDAAATQNMDDVRAMASQKTRNPEELAFITAAIGRTKPGETP